MHDLLIKLQHIKFHKKQHYNRHNVLHLFFSNFIPEGKNNSLVYAASCMYPHAKQELLQFFLVPGFFLDIIAAVHYVLVSDLQIPTSVKKKNQMRDVLYYNNMNI